MSHPFAALLRRYVIDYLLCQDPQVCAEIMEPDYVLHMADADLTPRDSVYVPAVVSQFGLFPGMGMTVHDLVVAGDRLAMRFSQHGASTAHEGRLASWSGIGLYRWNGTRLTETFAIEDYDSRRRQLAEGTPLAVGAPMLAPWDVAEGRPNPDVEATVRRMLTSGALLDLAAVQFDDEPLGRHTPLVAPEAVAIEDVWSAGSQVAFKARCEGRYLGGLSVPDSLIGSNCVLHAVGLVAVHDCTIISGHIVRGRGPLRRALQSG
jgi:predicted ester cyclase